MAVGHSQAPCALQDAGPAMEALAWSSTPCGVLLSPDSLMLHINMSRSPVGVGVVPVGRHLQWWQLGAQDSGTPETRLCNPLIVAASMQQHGLQPPFLLAACKELSSADALCCITAVCMRCHECP